MSAGSWRVASRNSWIDTFSFWIPATWIAAGPSGSGWGRFSSKAAARAAAGTAAIRHCFAIASATSSSTITPAPYTPIHGKSRFGPSARPAVIQGNFSGNNSARTNSQAPQLSAVNPANFKPARPREAASPWNWANIAGNAASTNHSTTAIGPKSW